MFGYREDEVVGKSITLLIPPDRLSEETDILSRLKRGERIEHYETVRVRKDKTCFDVSLSISPIRDVNGTIIGASKIARDSWARCAASIGQYSHSRWVQNGCSIEDLDPM
jgi:PAS domain S-box-containing protein